MYLKRTILILITLVLVFGTGCATVKHTGLGKTLPGAEVVMKELPSNYTKITNLPFDSEIDPNILWNESRAVEAPMTGTLNSFQGIPNYLCVWHFRMLGEMECVFVFGQANNLLLRYGCLPVGAEMTDARVYTLDKSKQRYVRWYKPRDKSGGI